MKRHLEWLKPDMEIHVKESVSRMKDNAVRNLNATLPSPIQDTLDVEMIPAKKPHQDSNVMDRPQEDGLWSEGIILY